METLFIALDGVPPRAKIEQQRQRRFHSINQKTGQHKIDKEFGNQETKTSYLDTNMITPGTVFMKQLKERIQFHISTNKIYKNIKNVIFSAVMYQEKENIKY